MADQGKTEIQVPQEAGGGEGLAQLPALELAVCSIPDVEENIPVAEPQGQTEIKSEEITTTLPEVASESIPDVMKEVQQDVAADVKQQEPLKEEVAEAVSTNDIVMADSTEQVKTNCDWQQREQELLKRIEELELVKSERSEDGLKLELKVREEEIDLLKARVKNLETELQAVLSKPSGKNHEMIENIKQQHEELLTKARGMIFDKTKMVKNQELQIEALNTQVQSLKDINQITKDLLEIRNSEVKAMEDRLQAMEARFKAEKDRYGLVLERAHTSTSLNEDLKKEYETQLAIFKELREKYEQRVQALVADNNRLKEEAAKRGGGTSS